MVGLVPPPPSPFDPQIEILPAGSVLHRVYGNLRKPAEFNPGAGEPTRFAFFGDPKVPVLYAAEDLEAAVCESVLHHLPAAGGVLFPAHYEDRIAAGLVSNRDLKLASFRGTGLRALGLEASQLTDCDAVNYPETVAWAEAAWDAGLDGCVWMSRRLNSSKAYVFFGRTDGAFENDPTTIPKAFANGPDLDWLIDFCASIRIDVQVG